MAHDPYSPPTTDVGAPPPPEDRIELGETLRLSWKIYVSALPVVLLAGVVIGMLNSIPQLALGPPSSVNPDITQTLVQIGASLAIGMLVGPFTVGAYAWVGQQVTIGGEVSLGGALQHGGSRYGSVFVVNLAYTVATTLGTMACFIPGVVLSVLMGPMIISAALAPDGTSPWNQGWAIGKVNFWPLLVAMVFAWVPTMLVSGIVGGVAGAMAVTGQTLPPAVSIVAGVLAGFLAPLISTTLTAAWLLGRDRTE